MSSTTTRNKLTDPANLSQHSVLSSVEQGVLKQSDTEKSTAHKPDTDKQARARNSYHHGDLRRSLIELGLQLVQEVGVEAISLRELAERIGVSTPALYHHFKNKQQLLFALGEASVDLFQVQLDQVVQQQSEQGFSIEEFVRVYVRFAIENPELYELMFGRQMWSGDQNSEFHRKAKQSFRQSAERLVRVQQAGKLPQHVNPLRLAQVGWATLHGLCRMYNDGLAFTPETIEDIARYACRLIQQAVLVEAAS